MNLKIGVYDANIFIDLNDLGLIELFFNLDIEIHTTTAVLNDLPFNQKKTLHNYQSVGRFSIHNLQEQDFIEIHNENYPKYLSETDKSALYIANKINAFVLSSYSTLRICAKNKKIECHGMIWIFEKFVESATLTQKEVKSKLTQFVESNFLFRNNKKMINEVEKQSNTWKQIQSKI